MTADPEEPCSVLVIVGGWLRLRLHLVGGLLGHLALGELLELGVLLLDVGLHLDP